ncbi:MAG: DUF5703 domain-containing protein [Dysgonamonadaceae bacterium]|nr:DUF5703 domain-containing protein [Dysgonamonadaceae bacterium]
MKHYQKIFQKRMRNISANLFYVWIGCCSLLHAQNHDPVDYVAMAASADLMYDVPASRSEEGMPVGNGVMGSLVWTTPSTLSFQINRVDVFANDANSNNFYEPHTDYCGGIAFVDIDFPGYEKVFSGSSFKQTLSCHRAMVCTEGKQVKTTVFAWSDQDVIAIKIEDGRDIPLPIVIHLRPLRPAVVKKGDHSAVSVLERKSEKQISLTETFQEKDFQCKASVSITVDGADAESWNINDEDMVLTVKGGSKSFNVFISSAATFDKNTDVTASAYSCLDRACTAGYDAMLASHTAWWNSFWERSFIKLHSRDGVADNVMTHYYYFMYVMGSSSRGEYAPKFNGMLWSTGSDVREWGNLYWGANQSCYYNGLFPANRPELMAPYFKMHTRMYPSLQKAAEQQWGSKGIYIPETVGFDGLPELPEHLATEMRELYLLQKPWSERSQEFTGYAHTKMPFNSRWNWKGNDGWKDGLWHTSDKRRGPFGQVTHIFSRGAKIAYQYWMQYEYSQDKKWLADDAYPMLKGIAEFYRNFPHFRKEEDGKYHIRHITDNESIWDGHNTVEEISSMMGIFPVAIRASEILDTDADLRSQWKEILAHLSSLPLSSDYPDTADGRPVTFVRSLPPFARGQGNTLPDLNTMPVWFFDLCNLESPDKRFLEIANNTFDAFFPGGMNEASEVRVLSKLPVSGVLLGRREAAQYLMPNQISMAETGVLRNRMDLREGKQTTGVQRLGRMADALHNALCQSIPPRPGDEHIIHVFPAFPEEWEAEFSLLCRGNFMVTSSFRNGSAEFVKIVSNSGKECRIRNPWGAAKVTIFRNGKKYRTVKTGLIQFSTKINDTFVIEKAAG